MNKMKCRNQVKTTFDDDFNVSDKKPDIAQIIREQGNIVINEQKLTNERLIIKGILQFAVLYISEDQERPIHSMKGEIPFEELIVMEQAGAEDAINVHYEIDDLSVSMINSRKINLRAIVTFSVSAEEIYDEEAAVGASMEEEAKEGVSPVYTRNKTFEIAQLLLSGQDTLRLKEELSLPSGKANIREILYENATLKGVELHPGNDKLAIKGELAFTVLYMGEEGQAPECYEKNVPFEKEISVSGMRENHISQVHVRLLNKEIAIKQDEDGEPRVFACEITLKLEMKNWKNEELSLLDDIYSTRGEMEITRKDAHFLNLVMKNDSKLRLQDVLPLYAQRDEILQICTPVGTIRIDDEHMTEHGIEVEGVLEVKLLCVTGKDDQPLIANSGILPFSYLIDVKWGGALPDKEYYMYEITPSLEQISAVMLDGNEAEIKAVICLDTIVFELIKRPIITDVEEKPFDADECSRMPGITGYVAAQGESLWDIAKKYHTTMQEIMELNHLEREELIGGEKLLIVKSV